MMCKLLDKLIDKYENSKYYKNQSVIQRKISVKPTEIFKSYTDTRLSLNIISDFEYELNKIVKKEWIFLQYKNGELIKGNIENIILNNKKIDEIYVYLNRIPLKEVLNNEIIRYKKYIGIDPKLDDFCEKAIKQCENYKKPIYTDEKAEEILKATAAILNNNEIVYERVFSVKVLGDTKKFKKIKSAVLKILAPNEDDLQNQNEILKSYGLYTIMPYLYFKGSAEIYFDDGSIINSSLNTPMGLSSKSLNNINYIKIPENINIMTIENLTSYELINNKDYIYIFTEGYHGKAQEKFIKKILENNEVKLYHFGDIDPDGFMIADHLQECLDHHVELFKMDIFTLEHYKEQQKPFETNDITKAKTLLNNEKYKNIAEYFLKNQVKLEQEIISANLHCVANDQK